MAGDGERFDVACDPLSIPNGPITPLPEPLICLPFRVSLLRTSLNLRRRISPGFASQLHCSNNGASGPAGIDKDSIQAMSPTRNPSADGFLGPPAMRNWTKRSPKFLPDCAKIRKRAAVNFGSPCGAWARGVVCYERWG